MKNQKGITLIALVITIIVMLILVGVSVTVALNGGLFSTAQKATGDTKAERDNELALSDGKVTINGEEYNSIQEYVGIQGSTEEPEGEGTGSGSGDEGTTIAAGLYKTDGTFISWEDLTSTEYHSITYTDWNSGEEKISAILNVDENGVLTSASIANSGVNQSSEFLDGKLVIGNNVTSISFHAFEGCDNIKSIVLPNSIKTIGEESFYGCGMSSIVIPNSVTTIGMYAFYGCNNLTSISLPRSIESIENAAFGYCYGLTTIIIPDSVTSIGPNVFESCDNLKAIAIPSSVTSIDSFAFAGAWALETIYYSGTVDDEFLDGDGEVINVTLRPYSEAPAELLP